MPSANLNALLAKLNKTPPAAVRKEPMLFVPSTIEEFMKVYHLDEWPVHEKAESLIDITDDRKLLGSKNQLHSLLKQATPVDMKLLTDLEETLNRFNKKLYHLAGQVVRIRHTDTELANAQDHKAFITEESEDSLIADSSSEALEKMRLRESLQEKAKKMVEHCLFPGFSHSELTELPNKMEAAQILHRVTKAQDFNSGFKKFWQRIFQSEASIAMMQDSFWWFYFDCFKKEEKESKDLLFNRIADSFVALFTTINTEIKDKIFTVYADCLAQAIVAAFRQAFPESEQRFQDSFKQKVINTLSEWIYGIRPAPRTWTRWQMHRLEPRVSQGVEETPRATELSGLDLNYKATCSLAMSEFHRLVQSLGEVKPAAVDQEFTTDPADIRFTGATRQLPASRLALCGTPKLQVKVSHPVDDRTEMVCNQFNTKGRSPLVAHFLSMHQLQGLQEIERRIKWLRISREPPTCATTYHDLVSESLAKQRTLSIEYNKICKQTDEDIAKIERKTRHSTEFLKELKKHVTSRDSYLNVKLLKDRLKSDQVKIAKNPVKKVVESAPSKRSDSNDVDN